MSRILIVSPEYASHYYPLSAIGSVLARRGHEVVVATGRNLSHSVDADGMSHVSLKLGPGSNNGILNVDSQSEAEKVQLQEFLAATRSGMVPTLMHQAKHRLNDLLWEPARVRRVLSSIVDVVRPTVTVVDHLAFGATSALRGLGVPYLSFHPGHPSAISLDVPYGMPARVPSRFPVEEGGLRRLELVSMEVVDRFTEVYNDSIGDPALAVGEPFTTPGQLGLIANYPERLGSAYRVPESTRFIGSSVRDVKSARIDPPQPGVPRILVSLGTFFSARTDILRTLVAAFREQRVEVLLAHGVTSPAELGPIPDHWTVVPFLPQPALLESCDLVVTHGGNNTVTESLTAGVPLLVGPLSTDQFAAAADIERADLGSVFDPNGDPPGVIADLAQEILSGAASRTAVEIGRSLRASPGRGLAADLIERLVEQERLPVPLAG